MTNYAGAITKGSVPDKFIFVQRNVAVSVVFGRLYVISIFKKSKELLAVINIGFDKSW